MTSVLFILSTLIYLPRFVLHLLAPVRQIHQVQPKRSRKIFVGTLMALVFIC